MASVPDKQPFYEAIEACRPGGRDLADPGLAFLADALGEDTTLAFRYQWSQAVDRQIGAAFADVAVPDGLGDRILETLRTALSSQQQAETAAIGSLEEISLAVENLAAEGLAGGVPAQADFMDASEEGVKEAIRSPGREEGEPEAGQSGQERENKGYAAAEEVSVRTSGSISGGKKPRRWVLAWGLVGAAAAAGLLVVFWPADSPPPFSPAQIQAEALQFAMGEAEGVFGSGQRWEGQPGVGPLAFSRAIWFQGEIRVRKVSGLLGREGLAYDLHSSEGVRATLYVVPLHQAGAVAVEEGLFTEPPRYDQTARTGGYCAAAWQENGLLYMLVVHRDSSRAYYQFFRPQVVT